MTNTKVYLGKSKPGRARSAITGRYVTRGTATRHPRTTVVESTKTGKSSKK